MSDFDFFNVQPVNPLAQIGQVGDIANQFQRNQLLSQENQLMQGKIALGQILQQTTDANGQPDWNKAYSLATQNPLTAPVASIIGQARDNALMPTDYIDSTGTKQYTNTLGRQQQLAGTPPNQSTLPQDKVDAVHDKIDAYDNAIQPLLNDPGSTKQDARNAIISLVSREHMSPNEAVSVLTSLPDDPTELRAVLAQDKRQIDGLRARVTQVHGAPSSAQPIGSPVNTSGPAPGVTQVAANKLANSQANYKTVQDEASEAPVNLANMGQVLDLVKSGAPTGTGTAKAYAYLSQKGLVDPASTPEKQREEVNKYMERIVTQGGMPNSDARFAAIHQSNPNGDMLPSAIQDLVPFLQASQKGALLKQAYYNRETNNGANFANEPIIKQKLDNNYDPRLVELKSLPPAQQAAYVKEHPDVKNLLSKYKNLKAMGFFSDTQ